MLVGVLFRNPVVPAVAIFGWEAANLALPPLLKRFSIIHHLHALYPAPPEQSLLEVVLNRAPVWLAVSGALALTVLVLFIVGRAVRRMDLAYGGE